MVHLYVQNTVDMFELWQETFPILRYVVSNEDEFGAFVVLLSIYVTVCNAKTPFIGLVQLRGCT